MTRRGLHIDLRSLANRVAVQNGFETRLKTEALAQTKEIQREAPNTVDSASGKAMTDLLWSSIDNSDSRDLDQIEYAEALNNGDIRVVVAIADVDAFVAKDSPIDKHAFANTTSLYTGVVIFPMLPEELSTDITSLRQDEDRLAIVTDMTVGPDGAVKAVEFYRARVRNQAKLAYASVGKWLEGEAAAPSKTVAVQGLEEQLKLQHQEADRFKEVRFRHGALNLETIEAQPVITDGQIIDIVITEDNPARELIENFMIAANISLARYLTDHGSPSLRRVVKTPKRWARIVELAQQYGNRLPQEPDARALSEFLVERKKADAEHFPDLSLAVVKLLGRGEYTVVQPGQAHDGHFGLGLHDYTHSTAPNRRYPDLIAQRLLKAVLDGKPCPYTVDELEKIAFQCTKMEDAANKVERFMRKAIAAVLLSEHIGETYDAMVTGVKPEGTYVRLIRPPAEGRVVANEHGLDVGDKVRVKLLSVDPFQGFIDFKRVDG